MAFVERSGMQFCQECGFELVRNPNRVGLVHVGTGLEQCSKPASIREVVGRIEKTTGEKMNKPLYTDEERWLYRQAASQKLTYHAPLADYIVPTESLRDRMAMAALTGLTSKAGSHNDVAYFVLLAYKFADAMLEERVREKTTEGRDNTGLAGSGVRVPVRPTAPAAPSGEDDVEGRAWAIDRSTPKHD